MKPHSYLHSITEWASKVLMPDTYGLAFPDQQTVRADHSACARVAVKKAYAAQIEAERRAEFNLVKVPILYRTADAIGYPYEDSTINSNKEVH